jgi:hypothetical protein
VWQHLNLRQLIRFRVPDLNVAPPLALLHMLKPPHSAVDSQHRLRASTVRRRALLLAAHAGWGMSMYPQSLEAYCFHDSERITLPSISLLISLLSAWALLTRCLTLTGHGCPPLGTHEKQSHQPFVATTTTKRRNTGVKNVYLWGS